MHFIEKMSIFIIGNFILLFVLNYIFKLFDFLIITFIMFLVNVIIIINLNYIIIQVS